MKMNSGTKKKIVLGAVFSLLIAVPALALSPWIYVLLDSATYTCPGDGTYTRCFLEIWKDGRLWGRRLLKPGESLQVNLFGSINTSAVTTTTTTTPSISIKNETINCAAAGGSCVPKGSLLVCPVEYLKTEDCKSSQKCCLTSLPTTTTTTTTPGP